jgi:Trypsin-like peptidase domain
MTNGTAVAQPEVFTQQQRADLAKLFAKHLTIVSMQTLAEAVLHRDVSKEAGNEVASQEAYATKLVEILAADGQLGSAVSLLQTEAYRNADLILGLTKVLDPDEDSNLQSFNADYEPFIPAAVFEEMFPRVRRTICAIGLDLPGAQNIRGTGFLIGPDLVMTNYHVVGPLLEEVDGALKETLPGDRIYCFFDYDTAPQPLIPPKPLIHSRIAQGVQQGWLVCAGPPRRGDGSDNAEPFTNQLDFAVIRLARQIGNLPSRIGGGVRRGWLTLEEQIAVQSEARLVLFQHPGQRPQRFDIGPVHKSDDTQSRVWYWLNSAKGSSGGAAVDTTGRLYAIHNAEVTRAAELKGATRRLNQGIRIDRIAAAAPGCVVAQPAAAKHQFWSLSDDYKSPDPVIGRYEFRDFVAEVQATTGPRVLVVAGPAGTGVRFSVKLLKRIVGTQTPVVEITAEYPGSTPPADFLRLIFNGLAMSVPSSMPVPKETEDIPRWIREDLATWFQAALSTEEARARSRFPAWIVVNTITKEDAPVRWANYLPELVATLVGGGDSSQRRIDIPQLRWMFLARSPLALPLGSINKRDDDLSLGAQHDRDFSQCVQSAREAINPAAPVADEPNLMAIARVEMKRRKDEKPRKVLANLTREMVHELVDLL